jgi:hypothetical protein
MTVADESMIPPRAARELAQRINRIEEQLAQLGRSGRRTQLGNSSIDSGMLVAGPRDGRHVRITPDGLRQLEDDGSLLAAFGAGSAGANLLLVVDPDTKEALASLSSDGVLSASGFSVTGEATVNGEDLPATLDALPQGMVVRGYTGSASPSTTSEVGWFELSWELEPGRMYKVDSLSAVARGGNCGLRVRYTTDGSTPTVSSPILSTASAPKDFSTPYRGMRWDNVATEKAISRLLFTVVSFDGTTVWVDPPAGNDGFLCWVEDAGPYIDYTGALSSGGGGAAAPTTYTTTWGSTWTRSYNEPDPIRSIDGDMWQGFYPDGYNGDNVATIGFYDADIRSKLAGAAIDKTEVYLYAEHWYYNSGGTVVLGSHNQSAPLSTYPPYARTVDQGRWHLNKPEGRWVTVTNVIGEWFRDGYARGLLLDALKFGHNLEYYGRFKGQNAGGYRPHLRIHYTK